MSNNMQSGPREIVTPFRPIPLEVPEAMTRNEFFNSTENLNDLRHNNGPLSNPENLLLYRKALGHSRFVMRRSAAKSSSDAATCCSRLFRWKASGFSPKSQ